MKKLSKVDKHDAPEGFVAVCSVRVCNGCYFQGIRQAGQARWACAAGRIA